MGVDEVLSPRSHLSSYQSSKAAGDCGGDGDFRVSQGGTTFELGALLELGLSAKQIEQLTRRACAFFATDLVSVVPTLLHDAIFKAIP